MTPFAYLSVLISIVLGLGLTELLSGVQRLVHRRDRVRFHWLPLTWSGLVFVALVQWWWAAFGLRHQVAWNFFSFLLILLVPVLLYLAAALVLPNRIPDGPCDLLDHYRKMQRPFFTALAAVNVLEGLRALSAHDQQATFLNLTGVVLLGSLAVVRNLRYHAVITMLTAILLLLFIVLETLRIS